MYLYYKYKIHNKGLKDFLMLGLQFKERVEHNTYLYIILKCSGREGSNVIIIMTILESPLFK